MCFLNHFIFPEPAHIILTAFSIRTNGEKLLAISHNPDQLPSLHGIRFISMMWVICGHRFLATIYEPNLNLADFGKVDNTNRFFIDKANLLITNL